VGKIKSIRKLLTRWEPRIGIVVWREWADWVVSDSALQRVVTRVGERRLILIRLRRLRRVLWV